MRGLREILRPLAALATLALVAACIDTAGAPPELVPELERTRERHNAMTTEGRQTYRALKNNSRTLQAFLSNTTVRTYDLLHGNQVEYLAADGRTFLWYPGNSRPVVGQWRVKQTFDGADMCFAYGANTYNPVTRTSGGSWECGDASLYLNRTDEIVDGDPIQLGSGRIPFALSKDNIPLGALARRAGRGNIGPNKVTW